jgi:hypothetical protein
MTEPKPQLGLVPEGIWLDKLPEPGKPTVAELAARADDIVRAIDRYRAACQAYPSQWYRELERRRGEINSREISRAGGAGSDSFDAPPPSWATLHRHLDMLVAAYIDEQYREHGLMVRPSVTTVLDLAKWSHTKMRKELADGDARG